MKKDYTLSFTVEEMRNLAEMSAFVLLLVSMAKHDSTVDDRVKDWLNLVTKLIRFAKTAPRVARTMERNRELGQWFFTPQYASTAFYMELLDEVRDAVFWSELVSNMAHHTLEHATPPAELATLSNEERQLRVAELEGALWHEVTHHGLDRLVFLLPEAAEPIDPTAS